MTVQSGVNDAELPVGKDFYFCFYCSDGPRRGASRLGGVIFAPL